MIKVGSLQKHDERATGFDTETYSHTADVRLWGANNFHVSVGKLRKRSDSDRVDFFNTDDYFGVSDTPTRGFTTLEQARAALEN